MKTKNEHDQAKEAQKREVGRSQSKMQRGYLRHIKRVEEPVKWLTAKRTKEGGGNRILA
jgi:hypothetical protein